MRVLYKDDGTIYKVLKDSEVFFYDDTFGQALPFITVDEISPDNKAICIDLYKMQGRTDVNRLHKYYVLSGQIMERTGWQEDLAWITL